MKPWTITFDGHTWTDDDVTTAHAVAVTEIIGDTWDACSPWTGPRALAAWIAVLYGSAISDIEKAVVAVYQLPIASLGDCLQDRTVAAA